MFQRRLADGARRGGRRTLSLIVSHPRFEETSRGTRAGSESRAYALPTPARSNFTPRPSSNAKNARANPLSFPDTLRSLNLRAAVIDARINARP